MAGYEDSMLRVSEAGDVTVISFSVASISSGCGLEDMSGRLGEYVETQKPAKMVVDFDGVRFLSSQVLGILIDMWKRLKGYGGKLVICGIDPQLNRIFRITHLDKVFRFSADRKAAIEELAGNSTE
jgi:anti-anti-sigma factor